MGRKMKKQALYKINQDVDFVYRAKLTITIQRAGAVVKYERDKATEEDFNEALKALGTLLYKNNEKKGVDDE
jgi:hypothetical protein